MMKNCLLCQRWVALTIPLHITNSVINTWQLLRDSWAPVCQWKCERTWVQRGGSNGDNKSMSECSSHCCHLSLPPMRAPCQECQWVWQGKAWLCLSWEWEHECSWLMGKMLISGTVAPSSVAGGVHLGLGRWFLDPLVIHPHFSSAPLSSLLVFALLDHSQIIQLLEQV